MYILVLQTKKFTQYISLEKLSSQNLVTWFPYRCGFGCIMGAPCCACMMMNLYAFLIDYFLTLTRCLMRKKQTG